MLFECWSFQYTLYIVNFLGSSQLIGHGSLVPFASQYLAHHLQGDSTYQLPVTNQPEMPTTSMTMVGGQNNTKNLANLSRLFRQLRPHLVQSVSNHMKSTKKQNAVRKELQYHPYTCTCTCMNCFNLIMLILWSVCYACSVNTVIHEIFIVKKNLPHTNDKNLLVMFYTVNIWCSLIWTKIYCHMKISSTIFLRTKLLWITVYM